jgi:molybdate transport repressor ModE-like protein
MLDPRRLRLLREVDRQGTIAAAAEELNFTASAVSQQLATLERDVGVPLLERTPRSVRLTEAGRVLSEHANHVLAALDAAEQSVHAVAGLTGGRLRVSTFASAAVSFAADALCAFDRAHPRVELSFVELEPEFSIPAVRQGELDLAVAVQFAGLPRPDMTALRQIDLGVDPLLLVMSASDPAARRPTTRLIDLADRRWISSWPGVGFQAVTEMACRRAGFEPNVAFRADSYEVVLKLAQAGLGVSLVPQPALVELPGLATLSVNPAEVPPREVFAVTRAADESPAVMEMLRLMRSLAADTHVSGVSKR